jgi:predicted O-methyltransferase YrrM
METEEIKKIVGKVEGWLSDVEGEFLYRTAKNCRGKGAIVEIGSWKGKSTIWLGKGSQAGNRTKVFAIDPHTGSSEHKKTYIEVWTFEEFKRNIKRADVDDIVIPVVKTSEEAAKDFQEKVEFLFIDGAHEYESVKLDFELWFPKLVNGGIIAFHDTIGYKPSTGPKRVAEEYVYKSRNFKNVGFIGTITFAQKVTQNSIIDMLKNRYALFLKGIYSTKIGNWILKKMRALLLK